MPGLCSEMDYLSELTLKKIENGIFLKKPNVFPRISFPKFFQSLNFNPNT